MISNVRETLRQKAGSLRNMPSIPAILHPLLSYLERPVEQMEVQKVVDLISHDKSLAAQCLHLANSPLFCRWQPVDSVRGAVVALGLQRMREIALCCSVLKLTPQQAKCLDPVVFWEHSLACALVCRYVARKISYPMPEKAYLGGLLHDFGMILNLWTIPEEFGAACAFARERETPLHEAELEVLGITHAETGRMLAEHWRFAPELIAVIAFHHSPEESKEHRGLVAIVSLSDLLCRMRGLGHGGTENREIDLLEEPALAVLLSEYPALRDLDWARITFELDNYMYEVHRLVETLYRMR